MDGFAELLHLSRLDATLAELREAADGIGPRRSACAERRAACAAELEVAGQTITAAEQEQRRHETVAEDQGAILQKLESQQHQVKSNDAYTALLSEMEQAKEAVSAAETLVLETMEGIETARATLAETEARVEAELAEVTTEEKACDANEAEQAQRIAELEAERTERLGRLEASVATQYKRVSGRRHPSVVVVSREMCEGCRVDIPAQSFIEILKGKAVLTCGTCRRLLIHQDHVDA